MDERQTCTVFHKIDDAFVFINLVKNELNIIFGAQNPEKINLSDYNILFTVPVKCSYCTLRNSQR